MGNQVQRKRSGARSTKTCNISETVQERSKVNRKSRTRFRLVPNSMTLDDLERLKRHSCRSEIVFRSQPEKFGSTGQGVMMRMTETMMMMLMMVMMM